MNTAIPTLQPTHVCEECDFPSFNDVEDTSNCETCGSTALAETVSNTFLTPLALSTFLLRVLELELTA